MCARNCRARVRGTVGILVGSALCLAGPPANRASTITVTTTADSGPGSLRAALASAGDGDTIDCTFVSGVIVLTGGQLLVTNTVAILGPGARVLTINGNYPNTTNRVFRIGAGKTVTLANLTITNGSARAGGDVRGGAIYNDRATLVVSNCVLSGNSARLFGGGIYNDAQSGSAMVTIARCTLSGNSAEAGGGIHSFGGTLEIDSSTLNGNSARIEGGAICLVSISRGGLFTNVPPIGATLIVAGSTMSGNSADVGGGIYNVEATVQIDNSTLCGNVALFDGGAICNRATLGTATVTIANSTLSGNRTDFGSDISNFGTDANVEIGGTILDTGGSGGGIENTMGTVISRGYNLSRDDGGGFLTGPGDQINTDPMLGPLQDNGGPTHTHALLPGSPAIDAGDPNFTPPPVFDQRGPGFARVVCGRIDIGAFEAPDTVAPIITCPGDIVTNAVWPAGVVVSFTPVATDDCSAPSVTCSPSSGDTFAIGTTLVTCWAVDDSDNTNACAFIVHVKGATEQIADLIALVNGLPGVKAATKNALVVKLNAAQTAVAAGNSALACSNLKDFINLVSAQAGKKQITSAQATLLIREATRIRAVLACS